MLKGDSPEQEDSPLKFLQGEDICGAEIVSRLCQLLLYSYSGQ